MPVCEVTVVYNEDWVPRATGDDSTPADARWLRQVLHAELELPAAPTREALAEHVYRLLGNNPQASKPDGFLDRTMCQGDLVRIDGVWLRCVTVGFSLADEADIAAAVRAPELGFDAGQELARDAARDRGFQVEEPSE